MKIKYPVRLYLFSNHNIVRTAYSRCMPLFNLLEINNRSGALHTQIWDIMVLTTEHFTIEPQRLFLFAYLGAVFLVNLGQLNALVE